MYDSPCCEKVNAYPKQDIKKIAKFFKCIRKDPRIKRVSLEGNLIDIRYSI